MSMTSINLKSEVLVGPERRRRRTPSEKLAIVAETHEPGVTVSLVARRHGIAPNQLFTWRRLASQGALVATQSEETVVPASEYRLLQSQVRELQRPLGKKTMGGCPMMGSTTDGQVSTFAEGRIAFLKAELGITDAQKSEWDAYAGTIKGNLQNMQGMWQSMQTVFEAKTPTDRLEARIVAMNSRLAALKEIKPTLSKLYAALSAEQKKKADDLLTGMGCMM